MQKLIKKLWMNLLIWLSHLLPVHQKIHTLPGSRGKSSTCPHVSTKLVKLHRKENPHVQRMDVKIDAEYVPIRGSMQSVEESRDSEQHTVRGTLRVLKLTAPQCSAPLHHERLRSVQLAVSRTLHSAISQTALLCTARLAVS
ncbi:unnamed protein product [Eretmochelys imbricata]